MKNITSKWLMIGENELGYAELGLTKDDFYAQVCVQAHQAVEKFLKAYLTECGIALPKTHDLAFILQACAKQEIKFSRFSDECDFMADFYIELRYPSLYPSKTQADAQKAVTIANRIHDFVLELVNNPKYKKEN